MKSPKVLVFAGSVRNDSLHRKLARNAAEALRKAGADVTLANLRDYPMPIYDGDVEAAGTPGSARAFQELVRAYDVLVIASPEYNGSFPALVKNAIDWASRPAAGEGPAAVFRGKTAALLSASPGPGGGKRGLRHLRELLQMIGVNVIASEVVVPKATHVFDSEGNLVEGPYTEALDALAAEIAGLARKPLAA